MTYSGQHPGPWSGSLNKTTDWAGHQEETEPLALSWAMQRQPNWFSSCTRAGAHQQGSCQAQRWRRAPSSAPASPPSGGGGPKPPCRAALQRGRQAQGLSSAPRSPLFVKVAFHCSLPRLSRRLHCLLPSPTCSVGSAFQGPGHVTRPLSAGPPDPLRPLSSPSVWSPSVLRVPGTGNHFHFIYLLIRFWLHRVFVAACRLLVAVASLLVERGL